MKTTCSLAPTHNPSVKGTSCGRPQAAPYVRPRPVKGQRKLERKTKSSAAGSAIHDRQPYEGLGVRPTPFQVAFRPWRACTKHLSRVRLHEMNAAAAGDCAPAP